MLSYAKCQQLVDSARDKRSKPVANNTRVERRGDGVYALRLHATDIATFYEDGRITINSGGWRTVTTAERLDSLVTHHRYSERGTWYIRLEPSTDDPEPIRGERSIPKPFHALDPGPEPVRDDFSAEHLVGQVVATPYEREKLVSKRDLERGGAGWTEEDIVRPYDGSGDYFVGYVMQRGNDVVYYGEQRYPWHIEWRDRVDEQFGTLSVNDNAEYKQCPHCELHERRHSAWDAAMNGQRYGPNKSFGYRKMAAMLERFGTREAWQDAYLDDFRAARDQRAAHKAWVERNRVPFEDGMEITAEGYAERPDPKAIKRMAREMNRVAKNRKRIDEFVANAVDALIEGMPMPSAGDCLFCAMRPTDDPTREINVDHLWSHIEERYYVPSLFTNAFMSAGYQPTGVYIWLCMDAARSTMGGVGIDRSTVGRVLRRYLYKHLVPEHAAR